MGCANCDSAIAKGCVPEQIQGYAVFDTKIDRFITSCWSHRMCEKILRMWEQRGRNLLRFEIRPRDYDEEADNRAILLIGHKNNIVHAFYHWDNRKYALAYSPNVVFPVIYKPPKGMDITDVLRRFDMQSWDGQGDKITFESLGGKG